MQLECTGFTKFVWQFGIIKKCQMTGKMDLVMTFLDILKACDSVNREMVWKELEKRSHHQDGKAIGYIRLW